MLQLLWYPLLVVFGYAAVKMIERWLVNLMKDALYELMEETADSQQAKADAALLNLYTTREQQYH